MMRWKIIIVNTGILLIVGALSYVLLLTGLQKVLANATERKLQVGRALNAAAAQLSSDGLALERWLANEAEAEPVRSVFAAGTEQARFKAATDQANRLRDSLVSGSASSGLAPSVVLFVDAHGTVLGRDGSNLLRGDNVSKSYPSVEAALKTGRTATDIWLSRERSEQMLASYAPVREDDKVVGLIVVGLALNDDRLSRLSDLTSGAAIVAAVKGGSDTLEIIAKSSSAAASVVDAAKLEPVRSAAAKALATGEVTVLAPSDGKVLGARRLFEVPDRAAVVLVAGADESLVGSVHGILWPALAVTGLGILLVFAGGYVLGNSIAEPIAEVEDGLLQIINGRSDLRFQIEHPDLGGLISRLNSLLNALMGVPETDDEGRTSVTPGRGGPAAG